MSVPRVLVVDDQALIRHAVHDILTNGGMDVVGEASTGRDAVSIAAQTAPDVVLMDIRMPDLDGIEATGLITARPDNASRVLILTTFEEDGLVVSALRAGASGFIGKGAEPEDIVTAVQTIHRGEALLSAAATRALIERTVHGPPAGEPAPAPAILAALTPREHEILLLVASGASNLEIASGLVISPHTAKTHVNRVMMKLGARDRAQLVILAYENGLVHPGTRGG